MRAWEWIQAWANTNGGAASILGLWVTFAALVAGWLSSRSTNRLIHTSTADTRTLLERMDERHSALLQRMDERTGRMNELAEERHREVIQAIQTLRG